MGEATPRPWAIHPANRWVTSMDQPDDLPICQMCHMSDGVDREDEAIANAALIVKAVNSHEALVEALRAARDQFWLLAKEPANNPWVQQCDAALALAEQQP